MDNKARIVDYLKKREIKTCTLATASSEGKPEAAVVGYAILDDLTIILSTTKESRKWQNLLQNPQIALTIGGTFTDLYLQLEGTAILVTEGETYKQCEELFFSFNPQAAKFKGPSTIFMRVNPTWVRFLDYSSHPPKAEEKTF